MLELVRKRRDSRHIRLGGAAWCSLASRDSGAGESREKVVMVVLSEVGCCDGEEVQVSVRGTKGRRLFSVGE